MDKQQIVGDLLAKPTAEPRQRKGYKKLVIMSGLSVVISPELQANLRARNMIVAMNGRLFSANGKQERLVDEARLLWQRIETLPSANYLRFTMKGAC
jgi:hypothetical protein